MPNPSPRETKKEHQELQRLLQELLPVATEKVRIAFRLDRSESEEDRRRQRQADALYDDAEGRTTGVQGALASAVTELHRLISPDGVTNLTTDVLASELIRIAYNRWQRKHRADERIRREAERGEASIDEQGANLLSRFPEKKLEFPAQVRILVDEVVERLSERGREVIKLRLDGYTQDEISQRLGCHRSTVSRVQDRFVDLVAEMNDADTP